MGADGGGGCGGGGGSSAIKLEQEAVSSQAGNDGGRNCSPDCFLTASDVEQVIGQAVAEATARNIDATIAVASTLCVVEPYMSGLGGVGVALVYTSPYLHLHLLLVSCVNNFLFHLNVLKFYLQPIMATSNWSFFQAPS